MCSKVDEIIVHHLIFTSGKGKGYHIVNSSTRIPPYIKTIVEKNCLVKGIFNPEINFEAAIRKFNCKEYVCISYVTNAGRDEYNRPGRLRAHVLMLPRSISKKIFDARILERYFINEDLFDKKLIPLKIDTDLINNPIDYERKIINLRKRIVGKIGINELKKILKNLLHNNSVRIYAPPNIETLKLTSNKLTTMDLIATILYIIPEELRNFIDYSTITFSEQDDLSLIFLRGPLNGIRVATITKKSDQRFFLIKMHKKFDKILDVLLQSFINDITVFKKLHIMLSLYLDLSSIYGFDILSDMFSEFKKLYEGFLE